MTRENPEFT